MSDVMMKALQIQNESLTRQVEYLVKEHDRLGVENDKVRNLLTEFDLRHKRDETEIELLRQAVTRYCDKSRMGTIEPMDVQHVVDRAFECSQ